MNEYQFQSCFIQPLLDTFIGALLSVFYTNKLNYWLYLNLRNTNVATELQRVWDKYRMYITQSIKEVNTMMTIYTVRFLIFLPLQYGRPVVSMPFLATKRKGHFLQRQVAYCSAWGSEVDCHQMRFMQNVYRMMMMMLKKRNFLTGNTDFIIRYVQSSLILLALWGKQLCWHVLCLLLCHQAWG